MSITELNQTAHDLMSVRSMIAELEAEAEALTDKLKGVMVEHLDEDKPLAVIVMRAALAPCMG